MSVPPADLSGTCLEYSNYFTVVRSVLLVGSELFLRVLTFLKLIETGLETVY